MAMDGLTRGLTEASHGIALGCKPRATPASASAPKAVMLRVWYLGEDTSQNSTVYSHDEAWKLAEYELMCVP